MLGDDITVRGCHAAARQFNLAEVGVDDFAVIAIPFMAGRLLVREMVIHRDIERAFD
jgi:hypothetical protein